MSETLLSSSDDSLELSTTENNNEILDSYSILFNKVNHNFSTSSEISFNKHELSPIDHNQTITKEPTIDNVLVEELVNFNPFLLLFINNDDQDTNQTENNVQTSMKIYSSPELYNEKMTQCASPREDSLTMKSVVRYQQHQSKR